MAIVFLGIFYWSMKSGQYDDTYTPSVRMLFEDKKKKREPEGQKKKTIASSTSIKKRTGP